MRKRILPVVIAAVLAVIGIQLIGQVAASAHTAGISATSVCTPGDDTTHVVTWQFQTYNVPNGVEGAAVVDSHVPAASKLFFRAGYPNTPTTGTLQLTDFSGNAHQLQPLPANGSLTFYQQDVPVGNDAYVEVQIDWSDGASQVVDGNFHVPDDCNHPTQTVTQTVTAPPSTVTSTVTAPPVTQTQTVTQTDTATVTAPPVTQTATAPGSTTTVTAPGTTVTAPGSTVTRSATVTRTQTQTVHSTATQTVEHRLTVIKSGDKTQTQVHNVTFQPVQPVARTASTTSLASTGVRTSGMIALGVILLVGGTALLVGSRRRTRQH